MTTCIRRSYGKEITCCRCNKTFAVCGKHGPKKYCNECKIIVEKQQRHDEYARYLQNHGPRKTVKVEIQTNDVEVQDDDRRFTYPNYEVVFDPDTEYGFRLHARFFWIEVKSMKAFKAFTEGTILRDLRTNQQITITY